VSPPDETLQLAPFLSLSVHPGSETHHEVPDDHDHHEDDEAHGLTGHLHAVPHSLDPLSTEDAEDDEEGVEEVMHVPAGQRAVGGDLAHTLHVALPKKLHPHHGKDEDDDGQHQCEVPQGAHRVADDLDEHVKGGPGLGELENPQL